RQYLRRRHQSGRVAVEELLRNRTQPPHWAGAAEPRKPLRPVPAGRPLFRRSGLVEDVAFAFDGAEQVAGARFLEPGAQPLHPDVDRAQVIRIATLAERFDDLAAADHSVRVLDEVPQQAETFLAERDQAPAPARLDRADIERESAEFDDALRVARNPLAMQDEHAVEDRATSGRADHIVVGAGTDRAAAVLGVVMLEYQRDVHIGRAAVHAQAAAHLEAGQLGDDPVDKR